MASNNPLPTDIMLEDSSTSPQTVASLIATDEPEACDQSKRVVLPANCLVILNGQKCQLRINPESGVLVAYPVKDDEDSLTTNEQSLIKPDADSTVTTESVEQEVNDESHLVVNIDESLIADDSLAVMEEGLSQHVHSDPAPDDDVPNQAVEYQITTTTSSVGDGGDVGVPGVKLPLPKLIIPSRGGELTSLAITHEQVAAVTKVNAISASKENNYDHDYDDLADPKVTITNIQYMKPVLKQYLISPEDSGLPSTDFSSDDVTAIGIKTSGPDLEKLKCPKCSFQAYYTQQYDKHLRDSHADELHSCRCCSYVYLTEPELIEHYLLLHPKNICEICHHVSEHAYVIKRHMYRHSSEGCTCTVCGKTYKDQYILKMHHKMVHTPAEVLYQCGICSKKFTRKAHLKRHYRTHNTDRKYSCTKCDYKGCERSDVTKHMLVHEAPTLVCDICSKTFRHRKNKDLHMKRHAGQRDFKCGVCDFFGYTFTDIRKHIERRHSEWKALACDKCGTTFKSELGLLEHNRLWHQAAENVASTSSGPDAIILMDGTVGQASQPAEHSLILNADGTMLTEEQVVAMTTENADDDGEGVIELTATIEDTQLGQEHFTSDITTSTDAIITQTVSTVNTGEMSDFVM